MTDADLIEMVRLNKLTGIHALELCDRLEAANADADRLAYDVRYLLDCAEEDWRPKRQPALDSLAAHEARVNQ